MKPISNNNFTTETKAPVGSVRPKARSYCIDDSYSIADRALVFC
jgi:hypothetical protein